MERLTVGQRAVGIIAPDQDVHQYKEIMTYGMRPCFALSLRDPEAYVGLLAHVDSIGDYTLPKMIRETAPILSDLGARKLIVETANIKRRATKEIFVQRAVSTLKKHNFDILPSQTKKGKLVEWKDVGKANCVILSLDKGLKGFSYAEGEKLLTPEEQKLESFGELMADMKRLFGNPNFILSYQPTLPTLENSKKRKLNH